MENTKKVVLAGNLMVFLLMIYPALLSIVVSSGSVDSECSGALIRPAYWLMTDGVVRTILLLIAFTALCAYLVIGHRSLAYGYISFVTLFIIWLTLWGIFGLFTPFMASHNCYDQSDNTVMIVWMILSAVYSLIVMIVSIVFSKYAGLATLYHELASGYDYLNNYPQTSYGDP
jgi:hypothetical protein